MNTALHQLKQRLRDHIALAEEATPGPWWSESGIIHCKAPEWTEEFHACDHPASFDNDDDAEFCASARTESPANARALLVAIEAIEGAPHKPGCWSYYGDPCDCWKANALARIAEVMS